MTDFYIFFMKWDNKMKNNLLDLTLKRRSVRKYDGEEIDREFLMKS